MDGHNEGFAPQALTTVMIQQQALAPDDSEAIERMLPRGPLGRKQLSNLRVYPGAEHPHEAQKPETVDIASMNPKNTNYRKAKAA